MNWRMNEQLIMCTTLFNQENSLVNFWLAISSFFGQILTRITRSVCFIPCVLTKQEWMTVILIQGGNGYCVIECPGREDDVTFEEVPSFDVRTRKREREGWMTTWNVMDYQRFTFLIFFLCSLRDGSMLPGMERWS